MTGTSLTRFYEGAGYKVRFIKYGKEDYWVYTKADESKEPWRSAKAFLDGHPAVIGDTMPWGPGKRWTLRGKLSELTKVNYEDN